MEKSKENLRPILEKLFFHDIILLFYLIIKRRRLMAKVIINLIKKKWMHFFIFPANLIFLSQHESKFFFSFTFASIRYFAAKILPPKWPTAKKTLIHVTAALTYFFTQKIGRLIFQVVNFNKKTVIIFLLFRKNFSLGFLSNKK